MPPRPPARSHVNPLVSQQMPFVAPSMHNRVHINPKSSKFSPKASHTMYHVVKRRLLQNYFRTLERLNPRPPNPQPRRPPSCSRVKSVTSPTVQWQSRRFSCRNARPKTTRRKAETSLATLPYLRATTTSLATTAGWSLASCLASAWATPPRAGRRLPWESARPFVRFMAPSSARRAQTFSCSPKVEDSPKLSAG
jgi:hypothetical protein